VKKKVLAIIPARGGSKGIKNKNFVKINNRYLIDYTILEAKKSKLIDKIIISTDSEKIIRIAKKSKVDFIKRPKLLSQDKTPIYPVIKHVLNFEKRINNFYDYIVILQPTTPLKKLFMIDSGIKLIKKKNADTLISVYQVEDNHPSRMYKKKKIFLIPLNKKKQWLNRQNLEKIYHRDGNLYICKTTSLIKNKSIYSSKIIPLILHKKYKLNIDDMYDLKLARKILK
jgi:CMP-N-acetylneuraminic acid synthetase